MVRDPYLLTMLGFVFEALDKNRNNLRVAWKRTHKVSEKTSREQEVLTLLKGCKNVVQLVDFFYSKDQE